MINNMGEIITHKSEGLEGPNETTVGLGVDWVIVCETEVVKMYFFGCQNVFFQVSSRVEKLDIFYLDSEVLSLVQPMRIKEF